MIQQIAQHWTLKLTLLILSVSVPISMFWNSAILSGENAPIIIALLGTISIGVLASVAKIKSKGVMGALVCAFAAGMYPFLLLYFGDINWTKSILGLEQIQVITTLMTTLFGLKSLLHSTLRHY